MYFSGTITEAEGESTASQLGSSTFPGRNEGWMSVVILYRFSGFCRVEAGQTALYLFLLCL